MVKFQLLLGVTLKAKLSKTLPENLNSKKTLPIFQKMAKSF